MKIFLAGKMDAEHGAWRDEILGTVYDIQSKRTHPRWEIVRPLPESYYHDLHLTEFPQFENTWVLGLHSYVGPYRLTFTPEPDSQSAGYFHGSTAYGQHGWMDDADQHSIVGECLAAIRRSDFVFAYVNTPDAYGTIAEIAYAAALGKYVHLAIAEDARWEERDYWYVQALASALTYQTYVDVEVPADEGLFESVAVPIRPKAALEGALIQWTARPRPAVTAVPAPVSYPSMAVAEVRRSFEQIHRWTSDPRVRGEAERMVRLMSAGGGK